MKKVLIGILVVFLNSVCFAQEIPKLKATVNGIEPIVVEVDGMTASELYEKSINYVKETYKNPDEVLKAEIKDEKIRFIGFAEEAWFYKAMGIKTFYHMDYSVEISFKDNKYKFEFMVGDFYTTKHAKTVFNYNSFFNKQGEIKKAYTDAPPSMEETINALALSHYNYVTGKTAKVADDW